MIEVPLIVGDRAVALPGLVFHGLSGVVAAGVWAWIGMRRGVPARRLADAAFVLLAGAWLGSWAAMAALSEPSGPGLPGRLAVSGHSSLGALAGAMLAFGVLRKGPGTGETAASRGGLVDGLAPALALAEAVARLSCFFNGCCHGRPAAGLPWAVVFPAESACAFHGVPVHPTQAYLSLGLGLLGFGLLRPALRPGTWSGAVLPAYLVGYGVLRWTVETFRGDAQPEWLGMRANQWVSLAAVAAGTLWIAGRQGRVSPRERGRGGEEFPVSGRANSMGEA